MPIRPALPADAQALAALEARLWRGTYEGRIPEPNLRRYLAETFGTANQAAELADPSCATLVVEEGKALLGYALLRAQGPQPGAAVPRHARPLEVARFYVDPSLHGTGAARNLMAAVLAHAVATGHDLVWLQVWDQNPRAIRFYAKAGFIGAGDTTFPVGDITYRDHLLVYEPLSRKLRTGLMP
jgi:ribosomal protein S18 acetylase RimI-like enzyme